MATCSSVAQSISHTAHALEVVVHKKDISIALVSDLVSEFKLMCYMSRLSHWYCILSPGYHKKKTQHIVSQAAIWNKTSTGLGKETSVPHKGCTLQTAHREASLYQTTRSWSCSLHGSLRYHGHT